MRAILLAAGQGRRLLPYTKDIPKALLKVDEAGGLTIIEYQVKLLKLSGVEDIVVVVGYKGERIKEVLGSGITYIDNPDYEGTNSLYSAFLTLPFMEDDVVVMNADVLFHKGILEALLSDERDAVITVDSSSFLDEETMKVKVEDGLVVDIRKDLDPNEAFGENLGVVRFRGEALEVLKDALKKLVDLGRVRDWFPAAFREFLKARPLYFLDVAGLPWIEVDFPEDLFKARKEIYPAIRLTS